MKTDMPIPLVVFLFSAVMLRACVSPFALWWWV